MAQKFSEATKLAALHMSELSGVTYVARQINASPSTIHKWKKELAPKLPKVPNLNVAKLFDDTAPRFSTVSPVVNPMDDMRKTIESLVVENKKLKNQVKALAYNLRIDLDLLSN